jgi:hypothetical protein
MNGDFSNENNINYADINIFDNGVIKNTNFSVNIILHVVILFTILANFFMFYIANVAANAINNEIKHVIDNQFDNMNKADISNKINTLKVTYNQLITQLTTSVYSQEETNIITNKLNNILLQIKNLNFLGSSLPFNNTNTNISFYNFVDLNNYITNFSFDYYLKLFKQDDLSREKNNTQLFNSIKITNILLIMFAAIYIVTLLYSKLLNVDDFLHIVLENCITFFFVGIVEIIFFLYIALKFIPTSPSLLLESLMFSLNKNISTN